MSILLGILLALVASIVPAFIYGAILWWFDRYEREPLGLLVAAFLWGAVPAIILSLIFQILLDIPISEFTDPASASLIGASVVAPITEELFKALALVLLFLFFRKEIDSPFDGIIYGCMAGLGFAAVENVLYLGVQALESGVVGVVVLSILRVFIFGLNHPMFTGLTGWGIAQARISRNWAVKITAPFVGLGLAMLAHGVHNLGVSFPDLCWPCLVAFFSDWGGVLMLVGVIIWATVREQRWITTFLPEEVELDTLSQKDYEAVRSFINREIERAGAFFGGDFKRWWRLGRYYRLATELAFSKRRLTRFPQERDTQERIVSLREQVKELGWDIGYSLRAG
ncbi:MAG: PrsW family intramembrane metalloprotease [Anaerolineae bacterium]